MGDKPAIILFHGFWGGAAHWTNVIKNLHTHSEANPPVAFSAIEPDEEGFLWIHREKFHESFCQDLTDDEALVMAVTQKPTQASTFGDTISSPAWKNKPCWYQISSEDRMINPENQKMMADRMNPEKIITLDASHASLASRPDEVTALIIDAATATQG